MGTNFYLKGHRGDDDPKYHIGKRSAAGLYCWDCRITLCKGGESAIHRGQLTAQPAGGIRWRDEVRDPDRVPGCPSSPDETCAGCMMRGRCWKGDDDE